jgi:uncharacterized protein YaiE (UPF0345 family)
MFKTNEYFGGKVKSLAFASADGPATVGVMAPGIYEFGTSSVEIMTVVSGGLEAHLPGSSGWQSFGPGQSFTVAKDVKFGVRVTVDTAYLCIYK